MGSTSNVPSAKQLAEMCWDKYQVITGNSLPATLRSNLENLVQYFLDERLYEPIFIGSLVPWSLFRKEYHLGHVAVADLLAIGALQFAISTNYDSLVEDAVSSLGERDYGAALEPHENPYGGSRPYKSLHKIHGCCVKDRTHTVWTKRQIIDDATIHTRIELYRRWLPPNITNKDLLITGFWTDWDYLIDILLDSLTSVHPISIFLVNPSTELELSTKAPRLWEWATDHEVWFKHIQMSAADFLDEFRCIFSSHMFSQVIQSSTEDFERVNGRRYSGPTSLNPTLSSESLYSMRRNLHGVPANEIIRDRKTCEAHRRFGIAHMRLVEEGAHLNAGIYELRGERIRLIHAAGQVMSAVREKFQHERLPMNYADKTICAGALEDAAAVSVVRPSSLSSIVRSGSSALWLSDLAYFHY